MNTTGPEHSPFAGQTSDEHTAPPLARRLLRLAVALAALWLIVYVLAPFPVEHYGPMRDYAKVVDRTGITPGALYYNDVDQSLDAETNNRDAIRFLVNKQK